ncbi:MAG: aldo/keto reductase, partial [Chloroflexaceae bacterium]|nr:aldo/keto reductase [Chloroflexaceae bacterium]
DKPRWPLRMAIENGINFIDVADIYSVGSGKSCRACDQGLQAQRSVISTKAFWPMSSDVNDRGLSRKHIFESVHKSLQRFDVDYIDIFFCHRYDPDTPTEETLRAISDLMQQGKILYWGTSMWSGENITEAVTIADRINTYRPVTEQPVYNMLHRTQVEGAVQAACEQYGIGLVVWSPLAQGVLTGKYNNGVPENSRATSKDGSFVSGYLAEEQIERARKVTVLAQEIGTTPAALALAWARAGRRGWFSAGCCPRTLNTMSDQLLQARKQLLMVEERDTEM